MKRCTGVLDTVVQAAIPHSEQVVAFISTNRQSVALSGGVEAGTVGNKNRAFVVKTNPGNILNKLPCFMTIGCPPDEVLAGVEKYLLSTMNPRLFSAVLSLVIGVSGVTMPPLPSNAKPIAQATANKNWGTSKLIQTIPTAANRMILSPDGNTIAVQTQTSSGEAIVELWNINTGKAIHRFAGFSDRGYDDAIAFNPDGEILAVSNYFPTQKTLLIKLWDVQSKREIRTLKSTDSIASEGSTIVFSPDGKTIASIAGESSTIQLWDVQRGVVRDRLTGSNGRTLAFSPDGQILVSSNRQAITLWNMKTRKQIHTLKSNQPIGNLGFSRDSKTLMNTYESMGKGIQRWNVETGKPIRTRNYEFHWSENPVFSPDGQYVASGSSYAPLRIYDLSLDKPIFETQEFLVAGGAIAFSPDGQTLAGITDGTKIKIWR